MNGAWTRRDCLRVGLAGGALWLGWAADAASDEPRSRGHSSLGSWLLIASDGIITLRSNAVEMGQGSSSALAQIIAEELEQPWGEIRVVMAPIEPPYFGIWNDYLTGGSAAVRGMFEKLRVAGATARQLLVSAAARHWEVAEERCILAPRAVVDRDTRRTRTFGELAPDAARLVIAQAPTPKPRESWKIIGKGVTRLDLHDKITGKAVFGIDAGPPGARVAAIRHAPVFGAAPIGDLPPDTADVKYVRLNDAVAAVSSSFPRAKQALEAAPLAWSTSASVAEGSDIERRLMAALQAPGEIRWVKPEEHETRRRHNEAAFAGAARVVEAGYQTPLLAHACMEPMNATARVAVDSATLWAPTQVQGSMRRDVAKALALPESAVTLHTTLLGGGFGRRLETDYGVKAALIARAAGQPVKLIWTREQDLQHDFYRQAAMARFSAALAGDGALLGMRARIAALKDCSPGGMPTYPLTNLLVTVQAVPTTLPLGAWRSVEANHNTFFMESFLDEVAHATSVSPLDFRRRLLVNHPRERRVLEAAVESSGMARGREGRHFGVAMAMVFDAICAEVVEVSVPEPRVVRIHRVTCAMDCGTAVNPDSVRAQMEGAVVMGLSAALLERVSLRDGAVAQSNFHDYAILRYSQCPEIVTEVVDSPAERLGGCGEPPLPPVAPALTNAIFAATGERLRRLPISLDGWSLA